jgi:hypothetical protein
MAGPLSSEGIVVAVAEESVTTTNAEGYIMARLLR